MMTTRRRAVRLLAPAALLLAAPSSFEVAALPRNARPAPAPAVTPRAAAAALAAAAPPAAALPVAAPPAAAPPAIVFGHAAVAATDLRPAIRIEVPAQPPAPAPAPVVAPNPAGPSSPATAMPIGNLPGWRQTFADDFATDVPRGSFPAAVATAWSAYPSPWKDSNGFGTYSPLRVVDVAGGVLSEHIRTEGGVPLVAALVPKLPGTAKHGVRYGRFAVRLRADQVPGYKLVIMLWPDSGNNAADGEIDFPGMDLTSSTMWAFMHRTGSATTSDQAWASAPSSLASWHTAVVEWSPGLVVFSLDGVEIGRTTVRIPDTPMHLVMQTETSLHSDTPPPVAAAGTVQFDWVAAWAYDPTVT